MKNTPLIMLSAILTLSCASTKIAKEEKAIFSMLQKMIRPLFLLSLLFLLTQCKDNTLTLRWENIEDPEKYIKNLSESVVIKSVEKTDVNGDDLLDQKILVLTGGELYVTFYFLGNDNQSYNMVGEDEFYGYNDVPEKVNTNEEQHYKQPEDYYKDSEINNYTILTRLSSNINDDAFTDAILVTHYFNPDNEEGVYESYNAALFYGNEDNTYSHIHSIELSVLTNDRTGYVFEDLVSNNNYYSFELKNALKKKIITFTYNDVYQNFMLHKYGVIEYNKAGAVIEEKVIDKNDFEQVFFEDYTPNLLTLTDAVTVTNTKELIQELGSNKTIYLTAGSYYLNQIENYPAAAAEALKNRGFTDSERRLFYESEFYTLTGSNLRDQPFGSYFEVSFNHLENVKFIGQGDVKLLVTDESLSVLNFKESNNVTLENLYLVHDVGGGCSANVVNLYNSNNFYFKNTTLDGSGATGLDAYKSKQIIFENSDITNCSHGAMYLTESNVIFKDGAISNNKVYKALIWVTDNSSVNLNGTEIKSNKSELTDSAVVFMATENSNIILNNSCLIKGNIDLELTEENTYVDFDNTLIDITKD